MSALPLRIVGRRLPGRRFGEHKNVHLGVQRGQEVVDLVPGDAAEAVFEFEVNRSRTGGRTDFGGPYVHGRTGRRFLYLSWGEVGECGFEMFRRAKLHLTRINVALIDQVPVGGEVLEDILRGRPEVERSPRCQARGVRPAAPGEHGTVYGGVMQVTDGYSKARLRSIHVRLVTSY